MYDHPTSHTLTESVQRRVCTEVDLNADMQCTPADTHAEGGHAPTPIASRVCPHRQPDLCLQTQECAESSTDVSVLGSRLTHSSTRCALGVQGHPTHMHIDSTCVRLFLDSNQVPGARWFISWGT